MRRILIAALSALLGTTPAFAADNYSATAGTGLTFAAKNVGGVLYPWWIPSDSTGAAFGVTGNPFFVSGAASAFADGWDMTQGAQANTACATDNGSCSVVALIKRTNQNLTTLNTSVNAAAPCLNATAFNTNSYSTGQTNPLNCDTHGNAYVNIGTAPTITTTTAAADPCQANAQVILPFTIPTNTTTNVLTGTSAKKIYVCYLYMQTGLANNVAVIEGTTGGTCGSSTKALVGGTTAATGLLNAANSGQAFGNGAASVLQTTVNNNDICIITSASGPLSGVMKYVLQ